MPFGFVSQILGAGFARGFEPARSTVSRGSESGQPQLSAARVGLLEFAQPGGVRRKVSRIWGAQIDFRDPVVSL